MTGPRRFTPEEYAAAREATVCTPGDVQAWEGLHALDRARLTTPPRTPVDTVRLLCEVVLPGCRDMSQVCRDQVVEHLHRLCFHVCPQPDTTPAPGPVQDCDRDDCWDILEAA